MVQGACTPAPPLPAPGAVDAPAARGAPGAPAGREEPFRVVVVSDLNSEYGSTSYRAAVHNAMAFIRELRPDLVLVAGDMIAAQRPSLTDDHVRAMWSAFDSVVAAPLRDAGIPFGFTVGNHDASAYPAHSRDRALAVEHWRDARRHPGTTFVDGAHFPLFYSFRHGPLFVVSWDASAATTVADTAMMRWLREQLAGDVARRAHFRLVLGHLPLYAVAQGRDRPGEVLEQPDSLRAILERNDVHTYISGHHHAYFPGRRGSLELLHAGAVGDGPRMLIGTDAPSPRTLTLLEFFAGEGRVEYTTYEVDDASLTDTSSLASTPPRVVPLERLPLRVQGHNGHVVRRDVTDPGEP